MPSRLPSFPSGSTVLVQGASRGIGLGLVNALLQDDAEFRVIATCRDPDGADWEGMSNRVWGSHVYYETVAVYNKNNPTRAHTASMERPMALTKYADGNMHPGLVQHQHPAQHRYPVVRRRQSTLNQPRGVGDIGTEGGDASRETERRARLHLRRRRIWRTGRARGLCGTPRAPARRRRRRRRARRCRRQVARAAPVRREVRWLRLAGGERRGAESALSTCGRGRRGPASSPLA